jgi:hypothetical protein
MLDPFLFVVAIMGCGDGQTACSETRVVRARYESMAECQANLPAVLAANTDVPFPEVSAVCRRTAPLYAGTEGGPNRG